MIFQRRKCKAHGETCEGRARSENGTRRVYCRLPMFRYSKRQRISLIFNRLRHLINILIKYFMAYHFYVSQSEKFSIHFLHNINGKSIKTCIHLRKRIWRNNNNSTFIYIPRNISKGFINVFGG